MRKSPNIIVTGTPGVGKSRHCEYIATATGLRHMAVNKVAEERSCYDGRDAELGSWIVDEDKVGLSRAHHGGRACQADVGLRQLLDAVEAELQEGGYLIDWHACDLFPVSWVDLVIVLRADTATLYDRLTARGYGARKLDQNMDAEIMQVLLDEARGAFDEKVLELQSNTMEDLDANVESVVLWMEQWKNNREKDEEEQGEGGAVGGAVEEQP
jgi:adenylate kinase